MKTLQEIIPAHTLEAIGSTLMHSIWQLAALALLLGLVLALLPSRAYKLRYALAASTMALMVLMPFATFGWLHESPAAATQISEAPASLGNLQFAALSMAEQTSVSLPERIQAFFQAHASELMSLWLLGAGLLALRFLFGCWKVYRLRSQGLQAVPAELTERFLALTAKMGIRRNVSLHFSSLVDTPSVLGAFKPMVLLPMGLLTGMSMEQLEFILVHELGHVRRFDYLVNLIQSMAEIAFFYHPGIWWVSHILREERENCCDEIVMELQGNKVQYARALLNLEVFRQAQPGLALAATDGNLKGRIMRITGMAGGKRRTLRAKGLVFALLTFASILLLATQSQTVVKAAMPFFNEEIGDEPMQPMEDEQTDSKGKAGLQNLVLASNIVAAQDSPVKKIVIMEDEDKVEMEIGPDGRVISGKHNGQEMTEEEKESYGRMAQGYGHRMPPAPPVFGMPPMPPMPHMGAMPPMPPLPGIGKMPALPPMPKPGADFDEKAFEQQMEQFGAEMERWGEQFAQQFEGGDWKKFEREIEVWGEQFGKQMESQDWEAFGEKMEAWGEQFGDEMARKMEIEIIEHDDQMSEDDRERMEEMRERERAEGRRQVEEERIIIMQDRDRQRADAERMRAEADARRAEAQAARPNSDERRMANGTTVIARSLEDDGLIKPGKSYKLTINDKEMSVNGKKQSEKLHRRYMDIVGRAMGIRIGKDEITISHKAK